MRILVVYATRHGSTGEVAGTVARAMGERHATVELRAAGEMRGSLAGYDLVVLGGALYSGRWHRDAHRFLKRHRRELAGTPVAVFAMGPRADVAEAWQRSREQLDRALARRAWLNPVSVQIFGGVDPAPRRTRPRRDLRDVDAIQAWGAQLLAQARATTRSPGQV